MTMMKFDHFPTAVAPPSVPGCRAMRVLLIEDDPISLKILKKRVESGGYTVETATDGMDGLEKFDRFAPHLIISDWMMPRMDGRELCAELKRREEGSGVYFILLTARDKHEDIVKALDTGADEYLIKPCHGPELMARLRAAQRLLELQQELTHSNRCLQKASERINKELKDISNIQRCLLPQGLPAVPGYRFAAHYQPSTECSGDFYDLLTLPDGRLGVVMGDVSGHGAPAMVTMALIRMLYRMEAHHAHDPADLLARINAKMFEHLPTDQYATMFFGILDLAGGELTYSSAGHPPAALCDQDSGRVSFLTGCEGYPIKLVDPEATYENHRIVIPPRHRMLFYTDGLPETFNAHCEAYGMDRIMSQLAQSRDTAPEEMLRRLLTDLEQFQGSMPSLDDLSLLALVRD